MTMRAVRITRPGGPEVLTVDQVPVPTPGTGEIRVRVHAFGVNRADLLQRRGHYPAPPGSPADIPGLEFAGEVDALDASVTTVTVGTRVMGIAGGGTYAERVVVPEGHVVPIPTGMSYAVAAAIPEAFVTAHDALTRASLGRGEWLLILAVGSGVGLAGMQLAQAMGTSIIGTSRTAAKLDRARALGLHHGVDTSAEDPAAAVHSITGGRGVDVVLDLIGGAAFDRTLACLAPRGRLVLVGLTAGRTANLDLSVLMRGRLRMEGTVLRSRSSAEKAEAVAAFARDVLPLLTDGTIQPVVHDVGPFTAVARAHELLETNATFGKVVVTVP